ncbi:hypothetical protein [Fischerella thermalis]|uniref:Uncharacterized protein n=1 Tax=Fischerella thermalis CCMEE 5318 TaxID=2019666 RepID=A0A2N6L3K4_9CYAN|nr:hypothetical protein [Fischerella thermalis]PMB14688.1 hypothetical protein CEN46_26565 [Fischerella thermalis CCMEE 5318]PMB39793.1 hypothetical protein CEN47_04390 [Fischerella thermalis CCMEE 5319]
MSQTFLTDVVLILGASLCPLVLLVLLIGFVWAICAAFHLSVTRLKHLHSIPCDRCVYFTGCQYLKCTVHPYKALTEDAVDCLDFEPALDNKSCCSNYCKD